MKLLKHKIDAQALSEARMSELALSEGPSGFRLDSVELFNWGTFGRAVWSFPFGGENALVTGDIGSGKSTWVDAVTTLLVAPQRITYNKAAGAERRERTDRSYLLGEYRSSRGEGESFSTPVTLRDETSYSVLLAIFEDRGASRLLSLAQVRWIKSGEVQKVYVVSGRRLSILSDFGSFDGDGPKLKKRLRAADSTEAFDSYAEYAASFRASMGITEKALDLFNQTVSMKTIGDLDDFIRDHMLEPTGARERLDRILRNFDNLRAAHDAVESTRLQRDRLIPIAASSREHEALASSIEELKSMAQALPFRAVSLEAPLLEREIERLRGELAAEGAAVEAKDETKASLRSAIDNSEAELARVAEERERRSLAVARLGEVLAMFGKSLPDSPRSFAALRAKLDVEGPLLAAEAGRLGEERDALLVGKREIERSLEDKKVELDSLKGRTTSIPAREMAIRRDLAEAVGAAEAELPFAGELLRVRGDERKWEGTAERVIRPFALSVLVPERLYRAVSEYVRATRLDARLVYYRVPESPGAAPRLGEKSLARVFEAKPDSPFRAWVENEVAHRADLVRCEDMERFYREPDAITVEGLMKTGRIRHEKDDRRQVADRRNYILGWSNAEKIALLERDLAESSRELSAADAVLGRAGKALAAAEAKVVDSAEALRTSSFEEVDVSSMVEGYRALKAEREELEASSDQLSGLKASLDAVIKELADLGLELDAANKKQGGIENELRRREGELGTAKMNLKSPAAALAGSWFAKIDDFCGSVFPGLGELSTWRAELGKKLESRRSTQERKDLDARNALLRDMHSFLTEFPIASPLST